MNDDTIFPTYKGAQFHYETGLREAYSPSGGLSRRDLFAAMAMQGLSAARMPLDSYTDIIRAAVCMADALVEELEKTKPNA